MLLIINIIKGLSIFKLFFYFTIIFQRLVYIFVLTVPTVRSPLYRVRGTHNVLDGCMSLASEWRSLYFIKNNKIINTTDSFGFSFLKLIRISRVVGEVFW